MKQRDGETVLPALKQSFKKMGFPMSIDTLNAFLQTRPFEVLPRNPGDWTVRDQERRLRVHPGAHGGELFPDYDAYPIRRRRLAREHHQVDTALHERAQAMMNSLDDIEQALNLLPPDIQTNLIAPLTTLHAELSGLLFVALLLAQIHPDADDQDVG